MTFLRLSRWDWLAFVAALGLLVVMSTLWWTTHQGDACRRAESVQSAPGLSGPSGGEIDQKLKSDARRCEAKYDRTGWSAGGLVDWLIKLLLAAAIAAAVAAAFLRAADRRLAPPWDPSAFASVAGLAAMLLLLYRILQPPGDNDAAVVKISAPAALVLAGLLTLGARLSVNAARERASAATPAAPPAPAQ